MTLLVMTIKEKKKNPKSVSLSGKQKNVILILLPTK